MNNPNLDIKKIVVGPLASNCYIIWDKKSNEGAVIDPGYDAEKIIKIIDEYKIKVKSILLTHGHFDHIGGLAKLKFNTKADIFAHKDDLFFIQHGKESANRWGFNIDQPPKPDVFLKDGDIIKIGNIKLNVIHTPGHSPGGLCYLYDGIIFVGDTLFQGSIGRTDFKDGSIVDLTNSIRNRLYSLPDDTKVYTGHGPETTIGFEKKYNAFVKK